LAWNASIHFGYVIIYDVLYYVYNSGSKNQKTLAQKRESQDIQHVKYFPANSILGPPKSFSFKLLEKTAGQCCYRNKRPFKTKERREKDRKGGQREVQAE